MPKEKLTPRQGGSKKVEPEKTPVQKTKQPAKPEVKEEGRDAGTA